jgi:hypothetical protein
MAAQFRLVALFLLIACSGGGKDDTTDTTDTTDTPDVTDTDTETGTEDTWWTHTGGECTGSGLCLCPDDTCGAIAGTGDCDRDYDGCLCAGAGDKVGECTTTTGGSGHSGTGGSGHGTTGTGTTGTGTTGTGTTGTGTTGTSTAGRSAPGVLGSILDLFGF